MNDDIVTLKERLEQYRRLLVGMPDQRTAAVLSGLIAEAEAAIAEVEHVGTATQSQQEQPS